MDKDPGALEVAKTNIWKEAVKLTPEDYNFRVLKADAAKILPNLELNFICADSLVDAEVAKQTAWLAAHRRAEVARLHELRDSYVAKPSDHTSLQEALKLRAELRRAMADQFKEENLPGPPLLAALNFLPLLLCQRRHAAFRRRPGVRRQYWQPAVGQRQTGAKRVRPAQLQGRAWARQVRDGCDRL